MKIETTLRQAAQLALDWLYENDIVHPSKVSQDLRAALEQPEKEPVAWMYQHEETGRTSFIASWERKDGWKPSSTRMKLIGPLYLAPPQRKPLTDGEIVEIAKQTKSAEPGLDGYILPVSFARSIEAAHGIGEKNE
jgi:hypothetical protein